MVKYKGKLTKATKWAAGYDVYAFESVVLLSMLVTRIKTGLYLDLIDNRPFCEKPMVWGDLRPRSGLASRGVIVINGTIDSDYRGEIQAMMLNLNTVPFVINEGDRIAQLVFMPNYKSQIIETDAIDDNTERGTGGFGSTGR